MLLLCWLLCAESLSEFCAHNVHTSVHWFASLWVGKCRKSGHCCFRRFKADISFPSPAAAADAAAAPARDSKTASNVTWFLWFLRFLRCLCTWSRIIPNPEYPWDPQATCESANNTGCLYAPCTGSQMEVRRMMCRRLFQCPHPPTRLRKQRQQQRGTDRRQTAGKVAVQIVQIVQYAKILKVCAHEFCQVLTQIFLYVFRLRSKHRQEQKAPATDLDARALDLSENHGEPQ